MTINHFLYKIQNVMTNSLKEKSGNLKKIFAPLSQNQRYEELIRMGQMLAPYPDEFKTTDRLVSGCQSILYLDGKLIDGKMVFSAHADALISRGLAALLISLYSGEAPEIVLTEPPSIIEELGITTSLSLNRSNGFAHIHLKMKQIALNFLTAKLK